MATIPQIILIGDLSVPISANYNARQVLFSPALAAPNSPVLIQMVTDALTWMYDGGNYTQQEMTSVANYLIWLCGKFGLIAAGITGSGGSVTPIPPGGAASNQLNFVVAASGTTLIDGQSTVTLSQFIGFDIVIVKNGTGLTQNINGFVYYTWNKVTGLLTIVPAASTGDEFQITPV